MAKAGFCSECKSNVWLTVDGACPAGHGADCISGTYEADLPSPPPAPARVPNDSAGSVVTATSGEAGTSPCPVCREGTLHEREDRGFLGLGRKQELVCEGCGAILVGRGGDPECFELVETQNADLPGWRSYAHKSLTSAEWGRIARGGVSDEEQQEQDLAQTLSDLRAGRSPLPMLDTDAPVIIKAGETVIFCFSGIVLREPRAVSSGVYGGPSIRIAKGVTIRTGAFQAESHEEFRDIDVGTLVLTNKRLVFAGSTRSVDTGLPKILSLDAYSDAIAVRRVGKEKTEFYLGLDRFAFEFEVENRRHTEPFSGLILKYVIEGILKAGDSKAVS